MAAKKGVQAALVVHQLGTGYPGNRHALVDISFTIEAGQRVAVIGPNGAGKSTLIKAIVGLLQFSSGSISVCGEDCYSSHSLVGYVPQQNDIDWSFPASVYDVVMMGRSRHIGWFRLPRRADHQAVRDILEHLSLGHLAKRQISELSGGQRRRVFIARALAQDSRVLLLDEPFTGVDQHAEGEISEALDIMTRQGITILMATHHIENAAQRFDKILVLRQGETVAFGAPDDILDPQLLRQAFGASISVVGKDLLMLSRKPEGPA
ncbi:MAG: metal ABC transporter ATP-binding protein [Chloroflexi bacterium]|nr:metal ABC transporter ATP-binding protein [Chloroflexota bacterium]MCY4248080.1 metal ABC transporter ATP-binding protein [Chloroflexota bacterium]